MTDKTKLHQNERLDIVDAKSIQGLVYEYIERIVGAVFGDNGGVLGTPPTANFTLNGTDLWADDGAGNTQLSLSGRSCFVRSSKHDTDFSAGSAGKFTAAEMFSGHVIEFNADEAGQTTTIDFSSAIADAGGIAKWKDDPGLGGTPAGEDYGIYARRAEVDADNQGRVFWTSAGGGTEVTSAVATRERERVEFTVDQKSDSTQNAKAANGWVLIARFSSVDNTSGQPEIQWRFVALDNAAKHIQGTASKRTFADDFYDLGVPSEESKDFAASRWSRFNHRSDGSLRFAVDTLERAVNQIYQGRQFPDGPVTMYDKRRTGESLKDVWKMLSMYGYHGRLPMPKSITDQNPVMVTQTNCWQPLTLFSGMVNIVQGGAGEGIAGVFEDTTGATDTVNTANIRWLIAPPTNVDNVDAGTYPSGGTNAFDGNHGLYQHNFTCPGFSVYVDKSDESTFSYNGANDPAQALNMGTSSAKSGRGLNPNLRLTWDGNFVITAIHCSPVPFLMYDSGQAMHQVQTSLNFHQDDDSEQMYNRPAVVQAYLLQGLNSAATGKPYIWVGCWPGDRNKKNLEQLACPFYLTIEGIRYNDENPTLVNTDYGGNSMVEALGNHLSANHITDITKK